MVDDRVFSMVETYEMLERSCGLLRVRLDVVDFDRFEGGCVAAVATAQSELA